MARLINRLKGDGFLLPGAPDIILAWATGCAAVELKRPAFRDVFGHHAAGQASEDQREFARRCAALGVHHAFVRSWEGLKERLGEWGAL
ncbi:MAG TPA: hypothetical protein VMS01_04375 [Stellaceae bacterium]|nr:hypothetical protein [Stellaceae bacterium]